MIDTNSPVSVRLDDDTRGKLNALANRLNSTPHAPIRQAVAGFIEDNHGGFSFDTKLEQRIIDDTHIQNP